MENRYGAFLESYNSGNVFFDKIAQGFFDKISYDMSAIINGVSPVLSEKFTQIDTLIKDPYRNSYDKIMSFANMIDDTTILSFQNDQNYRKNIANIIYGLLDVAKATEDSYLIDKSLQISSQFNIPG
jgi:pyoverdine/dityrosine biosynthesis protein Dit1